MFRPYIDGNDSFIEIHNTFSTRLMVDSDTGHMRFDPMPPQEFLDQYYNGAFTRGETDPTAESEFTPKALEYMRVFKDYVLDRGGLQEGFSFHDVGCGFGAQVWAMQQLGVVRATGNEVNRTWVQSANAYCGGKLSAEPLDQVLANLPYKVDVFFSSHVLEHVIDPLAILNVIAKHMGDESVAHIQIPNIHNVRTMREGVRGHGAYSFPMHLHYFTPKSLIAMMREAGLEPVYVETHSIFEDQATAEDCQNLLGWGMAILAVKPGNIRAKRQSDVDAKCEEAFRYFNNNFKGALKAATSTTPLHRLLLGSVLEDANRLGWLESR